MNPLFRIDFSISDSLKIVRKSVLIYETIILSAKAVVIGKFCKAATVMPKHKVFKNSLRDTSFIFYLLTSFLI